MKAIVKVQTPTASSGPTKDEVLIYAEGRRGFEQRVDADLFQRVGPTHKAFFYAVYRNGSWVVGEPAPTQEW